MVMRVLYRLSSVASAGVQVIASAGHLKALQLHAGHLKALHVASAAHLKALHLRLIIIAAEWFSY
jgi:hypothetical protein